MRKKEFKTDLCDLEVYDDGKIIDKHTQNEYPMRKLNTGHLCISVKLEGKFVNILVHRLVYELFVGKISKDYIVHHIDGNKYNNNVNNLQVMTQSDHARLHQQKYFDKIMKCPICGKEFLWTALQQNRFYSHKSCKVQPSKHPLNSPVCSRRCQGLYGRLVQNDFDDCKSPTKKKNEAKLIGEDVSTGKIFEFNNREDAIHYLIDNGIGSSSLSIDSSIRKCLRGKYKTAFGFKWKLA